MSDDFRLKMEEWLRSDDEMKRRHAQARLALSPETAQKPEPTDPASAALQAHVAAHGCGGCG